jgi:cytochrome c biogenesis protein CcmG/thiol:disulfide interchange protein DsbE
VNSMSKQWLAVGLVVVGLGGVATALTRIGSEIPRVQVGSKAPDFHAVNLADGDSVSLRQTYRGQVTLVNIWATWCGPCRIEMPSMDSLYDSLAPRGFKIAAVSIDEGAPEDVVAFARQLDLSFDILQDRKGGIQRAYETTGVPESFLLNRQGVLVKRLIGAQDWNSAANRTLVERLLDEPGS